MPPKPFGSPNRTASTLTGVLLGGSLLFIFAVLFQFMLQHRKKMQPGV